ncbi:hypothetical protein [Rhizobium sp. MHM7A]|uniref:hypothetical protein n=1 Tax=Rhizobium sp. MHM7A TaxID=2583233 RepID=UPI001105FAAF|nr:hypothetical protein [Rhizobium sp. MHM7A]TLX15999.1 hypothetical protein FFR93_01390 [Rhizobium sp. MHM7A]
MSRFGSLGIDGIQKIAADQAAVRQLSNSVPAAIGQLLHLAGKKFTNDARLTTKDIIDLFDGMNAQMTADYQSFAAIRKAVPATRVHPKGEKRETIYLSLTHDQATRCYQLTSLRLAATARKLEYIFMLLPFSISEHAVQRLMERVPTEKEALKVVTESMIEWMIHLIPLLPIAQQRNNGHMGIPASGKIGMLYGDFIPNEAMDCAFGSKWDNFGEIPIRPNAALINGPTFLIKTFVQPTKLRPDQITTMELMHAYQLENKKIADEFRNVLFWPDATLINKDLPKDHDEQTQALSDTFVKVFDDPVLLKGLKRSRDYEIGLTATDFAKAPLNEPTVSQPAK